MVGSTYQGLLQNISDHPLSQVAHTSSLASASSSCDLLLWSTYQLPSLTAFLLLPHPASPARMGTAHYDIILLSPIPGEVRRYNSLPIPSLFLPQASQKCPISKSSGVPGDLLGQASHFDEEKWKFSDSGSCRRSVAGLAWEPISEGKVKYAFRGSIFSPSQPTFPLPTPQVGS